MLHSPSSEAVVFMQIKANHIQNILLFPNNTSSGSEENGKIFGWLHAREEKSSNINSFHWSIGWMEKSKTHRE